MSGNVKAQRLLLGRKHLHQSPRLHVGAHLDGSLGWGRGGAKQIVLPECPRLFGARRTGQSSIGFRAQSRAPKANLRILSQRIKSAAANQTFEHAFVNRAFFHAGVGRMPLRSPLMSMLVGRPRPKCASQPESFSTPIIEESS